MSRKSKIDPVLKIKAVEDILVGKKGVCEVARELRVDESTVRGWRLIYLSGGPTALANQSRNKVYSKEIKLKAVRDYLDHKGSLPSRTKEEMRDRIAELERKNCYLQVENDLLKKVRELEMKDCYL